MKKISVLMLLSLAFVLGAKAQLLEDMLHDKGNKAAFSLGPELVFPSRSVYNIGYGASAKVEIPIKGNFELTITGGYSKFNYKSGIVNAFGTQEPAHFIPLKAGTRIALGPGFFFEAEAGNVFATHTISGTSSTQNLFTYSLGPAFLIKLNGKQNMDLGVRYESWSKSTMRQTAIRVAYRIGG